MMFVRFWGAKFRGCHKEAGRRGNEGNVRGSVGVCRGGAVGVYWLGFVYWRLFLGFWWGLRGKGGGEGSTK